MDFAVSIPPRPLPHKQVIPEEGGWEEIDGDDAPQGDTDGDAPPTQAPDWAHTPAETNGKPAELV